MDFCNDPAGDLPSVALFEVASLVFGTCCLIRSSFSLQVNVEKQFLNGTLLLTQDARYLARDALFYHHLFVWLLQLLLYLLLWMCYISACHFFVALSQKMHFDQLVDLLAFFAGGTTPTADSYSILQQKK